MMEYYFHFLKYGLIYQNEKSKKALDMALSVEGGSREKLDTEWM